MDDLRLWLKYEPSTGVIVWTQRSSPWSRVKAGEIAGCITRQGYLRIRLKGKNYELHRVAFYLMNGEWPAGLVDHINGNKSDNRWSNLRICDAHGNGQNRNKNKIGISKYIGVSKLKNRWKATITVNKRSRHLGYFETEEDAAAAYNDAKAKLHTFEPVCRHNKALAATIEAMR